MQRYIPLNSYINIFDLLYKGLIQYTQNIRNDYIDEYDYIEEYGSENKSTMTKYENMFDLVDDNLKSINYLLDQEQTIMKFFSECKQNQQKFLEYRNELINLIVERSKQICTSKEEFYKLRIQWNDKRIESPDVKNRRESEELLEEIKEQRKCIAEMIQEQKNNFDNYMNISQIRKEEIYNLSEMVQSEKHQFEEFLKGLQKQREEMSFENEFKELSSEFVRIDNIHEVLSETKYNLTQFEMKQIEEWTGLKCEDVLFDSNKDYWSQETSVFNERIFGRHQLLFLIEDEDGEKFGYYLNSQLGEKCGKLMPVDNKTFHFNIKSNGRLDKPMKFEIKERKDGCGLCDDTNVALIVIGNIVLGKDNNRRMSYCDENEKFNYHGIEHALCGKKNPQKFIPKRIVVLQMK